MYIHILMDISGLSWVVVIIIGIIVVDYFFFKRKQKASLKDVVAEMRTEDLMYVPGKGSGIIIPINEGKLENAIFLYKCLRTLGTAAPIVLMYSGASAIPREYPSVRIPFEVKDYSLLKVYCTICSPFYNTLMIDADSLPLDNLQGLLSLNSNIFWKCPEKVCNATAWKHIQQVIPYNVEGNSILEKKSNEYQSGKMWLVQKSRSFMKTLFGLADKADSLITPSELLWIACEISQTPYSFVSKLPGVIKEPGYKGVSVIFDGNEYPVLFDHSEGDISYINYSVISFDGEADAVDLEEYYRKMLNAFSKMNFRTKT